METSTASSTAKRRQAMGQNSAGVGSSSPSADEIDDTLLTEQKKVEKEDDGETAEQEVSPLRRSPMSVGKYNQWILVDANRELGVEVRAEEAALQRRREASTAAYHEARHKKTAVGRGQQELTGAAVREYRGSLAKCGEQGRSELMQLRTLAMRQKKEWAAHGARNASRLGLEQKKRVLEARAERFQTRRNAALQTKNEASARRLAAHSATAAHHEEKTKRLERVRENTPDSESLAEAREFFAKQKRDAAAQVRSSVRGWESARTREKSSLLAKASANRATVVATRHLAAQNRSQVKDERLAMAAKIRAALKEMEGDRKQQVEMARQHAVVQHRDLYERKFVDDDAADRVDSSEYGQLVVASRTGGGNSMLSVASYRSSTSPPRRPDEGKRLPMPSWSASQEQWATPSSCAASQAAAARSGGTYPSTATGARHASRPASMRGASSAVDVSDSNAWTDAESAYGPTA